MTLFAIFEPKAGADEIPAAIAERFSWLAFLLPPVFAIAHGLWLELAGFIALIIALSFADSYVGQASNWLYVLLALWIGFAAPSLMRAKLSRAGWRHRADRFAPAADSAILSVLERP